VQAPFVVPGSWALVPDQDKRETVERVTHVRRPRGAESLYKLLLSISETVERAGDEVCTQNPLCEMIQARSSPKLSRFKVNSAYRILRHLL
jgi:predicted Zn-ribbon and HTH transcriptional regulator